MSLLFARSRIDLENKWDAKSKEENRRDEIILIVRSFHGNTGKLLI